MTDQRDPHLDPRPGDVLKTKRRIRLALTGPVKCMSGHGDVMCIVAYPWREGYAAHWITVKSWRKWAKGAEVVHVAK
jgi:hypothetical protein